MDKFVKNYRKLNGISEYRIIRFSKTISSSFLILKLILKIILNDLKVKVTLDDGEKRICGLLNFMILRSELNFLVTFPFFRIFLFERDRNDESIKNR